MSQNLNNSNEALLFLKIIFLAVILQLNSNLKAIFIESFSQILTNTINVLQFEPHSITSVSNAVICKKLMYYSVLETCKANGLSL